MIQVHIWNEDMADPAFEGSFSLDSTVLEVEEFALTDIVDAMRASPWRMPPGRIFFATIADAEPGGGKGDGILFMPVPDDSV